MSYSEPMAVRLKWGKIRDMLTTSLPFRVPVSANTDDGELLSDYQGRLSISAVSVKVCLAERFEGERLGLWYASMPDTATHTHFAGSQPAQCFAL